MTAPVSVPVVPSPPEPILEAHEIQGNIFPGFNKSHQRLIGARVTNPAAARRWVSAIADRIATADEVYRFNQLRRHLIGRRGHEPEGLVATWLNVAFSAAGLRALGRTDVDQFEDEPFRVGLWQRATFIGDPGDDTTREGAPKNWVVGGRPETEIHVLLIVASDNPAQLEAEADRLRAELADPGSGLSPFHEERGEDLPGALAGHEHFGFKDGISQPGICGRLPDSPHPFLTLRLLDPGDPSVVLLARPGQPLIWPGQFVFGYPIQDPLDPLNPGPEKLAVPDWARNGSFLVFRRLRQDVARFRQFLAETAVDLSTKPGFTGMTSERLAALLVGRWPSGTPLMLSPNRDDPAQAGDALSNNHFAFNAEVPRVTLIPGSRPAGDVLDPVPGDFDGFICPRAAHIRKVNPRDLTTEQGSSTDTLARRILRRGIPFGLPLPEGVGPGADPEKDNRGLLFLCYQTSILDQFEFLCRNWMNQPDQPEEVDAGQDLIVGQNPDDPDRVRRCTLLRRVNGQDFSAIVVARGEWVIPTGGGYFFAPSVSALRHVLSR